MTVTCEGCGLVQLQPVQQQHVQLFVQIIVLATSPLQQRCLHLHIIGCRYDLSKERPGGRAVYAEGRLPNRLCNELSQPSF
jgi:hypothetical protein